MEPVVSCLIALQILGFYEPQRMLRGKYTTFIVIPKACSDSMVLSTANHHIFHVVLVDFWWGCQFCQMLRIRLSQDPTINWNSSLELWNLYCASWHRSSIFCFEWPWQFRTKPGVKWVRDWWYWVSNWGLPGWIGRMEGSRILLFGASQICTWGLS